MQREKRWSLDDVWVYPQPENIGLTLDPDRGDRVVSVRPQSATAKAGVVANDRLIGVNGVKIASVADVQYALHRAPKQGILDIVWEHKGKEQKGTIELSENWRKTDVSWRWSLKSLSPSPSIIGENLDQAERKKHGLEPDQLAYRQMNFLPPAARHAGLQANDIIVGINDQKFAMSARQFEAHIRLNHRVGEEITLNVLRGKEPIRLKLKLPE